MTAFVIGYDPGGENAHGVAVLEVREQNERWHPTTLQVGETRCLQDAIIWFEQRTVGGRIVAAGIDTLTEWSTGSCGWRVADWWLRKQYPAVAASVIAPNSIYGSMALNGAAFLTLLAARFRSDGTMITEAHPKVCFFALKQSKHAWDRNHSDMGAWLLKELEIAAPADAFAGAGHCFDAGMSVLAALRGVNRDWNFDLHSLQSQADEGRVRFVGQTHYWWPTITR